MEFNATFLVSMFSFIVFVFLMNRLFYAPITKIINEREMLMASNYNDAQEMSDKANGLIKERDEKLSAAETSARKTIAESIQEFNAKSKETISDAAEKSSSEIANKKLELKQEYSEAQAVLNLQIESLAEAVAEKVLGTKVASSISKLGDSDE